MRQEQQTPPMEEGAGGNHGASREWEEGAAGREARHQGDGLGRLGGHRQGRPPLEARERRPSA
jgi:hypothetical protein